MRRLILSAFSVVLATAAIAPAAQALPELDSKFSLQTLRLSEFDTRNKSEEYSEPYYSQPATYNTPQNAAEQESAQTSEPSAWEPAESTVWETTKIQEEASSPARSLTDRRHESLDRS